MSLPQTDGGPTERRFHHQLLLWKTIAGVTTVALVGVAAWALTSRETQTEVPASPSAKTPTTSAQREPAPKSPKWLDERLLAHLRQWIKDNPSEYLVAIKMCEGAILCMSDPALKGQASGEIERLERRRRKAGGAALARAEKAAGDFARDGDYDSAVALFDNVPEQFADLIGNPAKAAKAQFQAEAEQKIRAVLTVARRFGEAKKPEGGLAALDRMNIVYTPMVPEIEKLRVELLVIKKKLDAERLERAIAAAREGIWKLLDRVEALVPKGDLAGAARLVEAALDDDTLRPAEELLKRVAAVCRLLPEVRAKPADWTPANPDEAVAAAVLALGANDTARMAASLRAAKGHPLYDRYQRKMLWLRFRLGQATGAGTRRRLVRIAGNDENLKDCVVKIRIPYDSDMRRDYADLRFLGNGGQTLDYWIEKPGKKFAAVWVRVPSILRGGTTLGLYYGNPQAKPVGNGRKVFLFFDDFSAGLDNAVWKSNGAAQVRDGLLTVSGGDNNHLGWLDLSRLLPGRLIIEARLKAVRGRMGMHGGMALFAENETCSHQGWSIRRGLAGIDYNYDPYNRGKNNPNPKSFGLIPLKQGVKLTPFWNDTWFRQTLAYDGTAARDNIRFVRDKDGKPETLVHTGRRTDRRVKLVIQPWSWTRAQIEVDWIAVRPFAAKEPTVSVGDEIVVAPTAKLHPLRKGLAAFWAANGDARDSIGAHHGAIKGNVTYTADRHGRPKGAFLLDGKTGWIRANDGRSTLQLTGDLTYSAWIKTTAKQGGVILGRSSGSDATRIGSHMTMSRGGALAMGICGPRYVPGQSAASGGVRVNDGRWHHVAAVYVAGKSMTVYVDGERAGQNTANIFPKLNPRKLPVCIGSRVSAFFFQGAIDDVGIWHRALSAAEIKLLHATDAALLTLGHKPRPTGMPRRGLVAFWRADGVEDPGDRPRLGPRRRTGVPGQVGGYRCFL